MNNSELQQWKVLVNDAIIEGFGTDTREQRLAQALENAIDELEFIADECDYCKYCYTHGGHEEDAPLVVEADDVIAVYGKLKKRIQAFKDFHVTLSGELVERADPNQLTEPLVDIIEETELELDELEALTIR